MAGKVLKGPIVVHGDLLVTGNINRGALNNSLNQNLAAGAALQVAAQVPAQGGASVGTTTPAAPASVAVQGFYDSIRITWEAQANLRFLDHYELQVSSDQSSWYSLRDDGVDWKGTLNAVTSCSLTTYLHQDLPLLGTADAPTSITLYYRIRQITTAGATSSWSAVTPGIASPIPGGKIAALAVNTAKMALASVDDTILKAGAVVAGKIAANAVVAGNVAANAIQAGQIAANGVEAGDIAASAVTSDTIAANAVTTDKLQASDILFTHSFGSQPAASPANGDLRSFNTNPIAGLAAGESGYINIDEYINGGWRQLFGVNPSSTGNDDVLDLNISGRLFGTDSLLSAPGRFFNKAQDSPFGASAILSCAYGNGVFLAGADSGKIARSTDSGVTWGSLITNPFGASNILALAYGNGVFLAGAADGKIARSTDYGVTWGSLITNPFGTSAVVNFSYGNGIFISTGDGGKIARSTDYGITWGSLITNPFGTSTLYAAGYGDGIFIVGGGDGIGGNAKIARSTDYGVTWGSLITNPFGTSIIYEIEFGGGVFLAVAALGKIARSTDSGVTWGSLITNPFGTSAIIDVVYNNGVFLVGTYGGKIARSLDNGITWGIRYGDSSILVILTTNIYAIASNGLGRFVIVGDDTTGISLAYTDYVEAGAGIIESGSNSNGSWVKFDDGTMMQRGVFPGGTTSNAGPWTTNPYFYEGFVTLPTSFIVTDYYINVVPGRGNNFPFSGYSRDNQKTISGFAHYIFNNVNEAILDGTWEAIGRWK